MDPNDQLNKTLDEMVRDLARRQPRATARALGTSLEVLEAQLGEKLPEEPFAGAERAHLLTIRDVETGSQADLRQWVADGLMDESQRLAELARRRAK